MNDWTERCRTADQGEIKSWNSRLALPHTNTGIICGVKATLDDVPLVAFDIDVLIPAVQEMLETVAVGLINGKPPRRVGQAPKSLLLCRSEIELRSGKTPHFSMPDGTEAGCEILASGNQFVAYGGHPVTGKDYQWGDAHPLNTDPHTLPLVDQEQCQLFLMQAEALLRAAGGWTETDIKERNRKGREAAGLREGGTPNVERIIKCLEEAPNDCDGRDWARMLMLVKTFGGESAWPAFSDWSAKSARDVPEFTQERWEKAKPVHSMQANSIFWIALQQGWKAPHREEIAPRPTTPLILTRWGEWQDKPIPRKRFLVPGLLPGDEVACLSGDPGIGKTTVGLHLQTALHLVLPWLGLYTEGPARSLGIYCEETDEDLARRQEAINHYCRCQFVDISEGSFAIGRRGHDNLLGFYHNGQLKRAPYYEQVLTMAMDLKVSLLILDHLAHVFPGNENDRYEVTQFATHILNPLSMAFGAILLSGHPSRSGQIEGSGRSGSSGWDGVWRARSYLSWPLAEPGEPEDLYGRVLTCQKSNWAPRGIEQRLYWHNGVIIPIHVDPTKEQQRPSAEDAFLELLDLATEEHRNVSADRHAPNYAPRDFAKAPKSRRHGYGEKDFVAALFNLLQRDHKVEVVEYRQDRQPRYRLARAGSGGKGREAF
jgi:hypothetical protein